MSERWIGIAENITEHDVIGQAYISKPIVRAPTPSNNGVSWFYFLRTYAFILVVYWLVSTEPGQQILDQADRTFYAGVEMVVQQVDGEHFDKMTEFLEHEVVPVLRALQFYIASIGNPNFQEFSDIQKEHLGLSSNVQPLPVVQAKPKPAKISLRPTPKVTEPSQQFEPLTFTPKPYIPEDDIEILKGE